MQFISKKPEFEYLRNKWSVRQKTAQNNFWDKHASALKQIALGSLGGLILLSPPSHMHIPDHNLLSRDDVVKGFDRNILLAQVLSDKLPGEVVPLDSKLEQDLAETLSAKFGFKVTSEINNIKLNRNYGIIGGEQHLYRYPGDNLYAHAKNAIDWAKYSDAGIAPHLGAWGYFAPFKGALTKQDEQRERYYLAVQTFLAPGFSENVDKYRDFFKFRKMLVINPKSGQAVVAVIGDAGPGEFTGKHLGGSPEVMDGLGLATGSRKGAVLFFFIDDPEDKIPLGPLKVPDNKA